MDRRNFRLIQGGALKNSSTMDLGPAARLDIWSRFQPSHSRLVAFAIFAKLALLASLMYFFLGR